MEQTITRKEAIRLLDYDSNTKFDYRVNFVEGAIKQGRGKYLLSDIMAIKNRDYPIVCPVMRLTDSSQETRCKKCLHSGLRLTDRDVCINCTHRQWGKSSTIDLVRR